MKRKSGEPTWKWRRSLAIAVVVFGLYMLWDLRDAADTMVNRSIVDSAFLLVTLFGLGYSGLATTQDVIAIWRTKSALPYRESESESEQQP